MSTLMSRDLNLTRPSTKVHAAPGGNSSICFGSEPAAPAYRAPPQQQYQQQQAVPKENHFQSANYDRNNRGNSSNDMKAIMNPQEQPVRRVRQAPGGASTFTLG